MSTNQQIIDRVLKKLGVLGKGQSGDATDSATILGVMNRMVLEWQAKGTITLGWFSQDTLGDTAPLPEWAEEAVISNTAVRGGTDVRAMVTQMVYDEARETKKTLLTISLNNTLDNADMSHLPYGEGRLNRYDIEVGS